MSKLLFWIGIVVLLVAADRALLAMESRGWINYRRHGPHLSAARYHVMEMHSIWEPGIQQVIESHYREQKNEDESGDPNSEEDEPAAG
ncbi:MAG TPA: hypothetical protein VLK84_31300 [Longimicrobium sp.]|nr:hypothetical protein [Longimicrobium sp.]